MTTTTSRRPRRRAATTPSVDQRRQTVRTKLDTFTDGVHRDPATVVVNLSQLESVLHSLEQADQRVDALMVKLVRAEQEAHQ